MGPSKCSSPCPACELESDACDPDDVIDKSDRLARRGDVLLRERDELILLRDRHPGLVIGSAPLMTLDEIEEMFRFIRKGSSK